MKNNIIVDNELIAKLSKLAKLKFNKPAAEMMKSDLKMMLSFVEAISQVDTKDVEPLIYMSDELNILRNDEITNEVCQQDALKNAPLKDSDYFKVPTVLKK
jgi:aspartyl-tRNA(Asn)/glutamyl-tRNA(Gln) amidotransferase subunit C